MCGRSSFDAAIGVAQGRRTVVGREVTSTPRKFTKSKKKEPRKVRWLHLADKREAVTRVLP